MKSGRRKLGGRLALCAGLTITLGLPAQTDPRGQTAGDRASRDRRVAEQLQRAARAASNPLRALGEATATNGISNPRGDDALRNLPAVRPPNRQRSTRSYRRERGDDRSARTDNANSNRARKPAKAQKQPAEKLETFVLKANIILGDGRSVRGRVTFRAPAKIVVRHKHNDIEYRKTVRLRDVRAIEITQWKGEPMRKNRSGEWIYRFGPRRSTVTLAGDLVLKENARLLPYFEKLTIRNANGEVTLFSYWVDLLKKDGSWYTGITGPTNGLRRTGHKDVVQRIEFNRPDDD